MFNKLFDLNNDGKLDAGERAWEFLAFTDIVESSDNDGNTNTIDEEDD